MKKTMRSVVKTWGNSAFIQIPSTILKAAKIEIDEPVDIREEQGRMHCHRATAVNFLRSR
jgi:antitoxin MazE